MSCILPGEGPALLGRREKDRGDDKMVLGTHEGATQKGVQSTSPLDEKRNQNIKQPNRNEAKLSEGIAVVSLKLLWSSGQRQDVPTGLLMSFFHTSRCNQVLAHLTIEFLKSLLSP